MDFNNLVKKRESCRNFKEQDVDVNLVKEIVTNATNAPSACNSQPWKFVICAGETAKKMPDIIISPNLKINLWTTKVPAFVVVCETKAKLMSGLDCDSQKYAAFDLGSATTTLCLSAADKGLSTCIIGVFDDAKLKETLKIPTDTKIRCIVAIGYGISETPRDKFRKNIDEVISINEW
ncbi:MAG: nitroreductase family protein [Clostridia bacterium]